MSAVSRLLARIGKLPPAETYRLAITRDLRTPMRDGAVLLGDHYAPRADPRRATVLVRSPYGRAGVWGVLYGRLFAERGFQVLIQSVRGTFGSGGVFDPFRQEHDDGLDTVAWLRQQPWFTGELFSIGPSYLGLTQWSVAPYVGDLKAIAPQITSSEFANPQHPGGAFTFEDILSWTYQINTQERRRGGLLSAIFARQAAALKPAFATLPLKDADLRALGKHVPFYQSFLEHVPGDEWWAPADHSGNVANVSVPISLVGGWYDIFLPWQLRDYRLLREAGRDPSLLIGPWTHGQPASIGPMLRESLRLFKAASAGKMAGKGDTERRAPVRIFVMGAKQWRDLPEWPPTPVRVERWHLQPSRGLALADPVDAAPDEYRYDPADPTPSVGGALLGTDAGPRDNRALEARADVLTYTSIPLVEDLEVIGPLTAEVYLKSSLEHTDVFVRLCDVLPSGKSINVSDGILRLTPGQPPADAEGIRRAEVELWPTAHRFLRGHRIRVQVSSGAFPRFSRNTGSGEPLASATTLIPADQAIYHDAAHPSAILLPVL
jgi:putative CocE/NonD family hydrolase